MRLSPGQEDLRSWARAKRPSHYRRTCPFCSHYRQSKKDPCLSVEVTEDRAIYTCWHCEEKGMVMLEDQPQRKVIPLPVVPKGAVKHVGTSLDSFARNWLKSRGISDTTANLYGVTAAQAYFPTLQRNTPAIAFPYIVNGKPVGHKVRSTEEKANVCDRPLASLCGLQTVDLSEENHIVICEGEPDMLAMAEAGVINVTSVPNGASSFASGKDEGDRAVYGFLWSAKELIGQAARVYIAADADDPGEKLADEMARRIGRYKCWRVNWPEGCKDANDVLLRHGGDVLRGCVDCAEPWPIAGLYEAEKYFESVRNLYNNGYADTIKTGMTGVDPLYSINPGMLTVVTGIPANGKSTFVDQLMINAARQYGHTFAICSFENPPHVHIGKLAEMLAQKHFFPVDLPGDRMTEEELNNVLPFIHKHFKFMQQDDGEKADIDSILERIKTAVFRWGIRGAVIDPYNYITRPKSAESETQWIDDVLTRIRLLAQAYDLHIWFVAHPTKMVADSSGHYPPPRGYSISGSSAWYAKADFGLTVHKEPEDEASVRIINWKTRWHWLGKEGEISLLWDKVHHTYMSDIVADLPPYTGEFDYGEEEHRRSR